MMLYGSEQFGIVDLNLTRNPHWLVTCEVCGNDGNIFLDSKNFKTHYFCDKHIKQFYNKILRKNKLLKLFKND